MSEGTKRRLAAIVAADVAGYSRLVGLDEVGTLSALRALRKELIDPLVAEHGGRIVKTMGDGLLMEFPSVVDAVQSMIEVQRGMAERNRDADAARRITFRIGVNLGDVISDGEDILGDGVNIAARLQEIAEPGGISVSARIHEDIRDRLDAAFADTGEQRLKNIARPVRVWRWVPNDAAAAGDAADRAPPPLPDKPSIAVLPFDNMSSDAELEFFGDGIAEDIITTLSKVSGMRVIARNSTFAYKGTSPDIRRIAEDLGVRFVLEGSVRGRGDRLRITAQLIDAGDGSHVWAERYDRVAQDLFDIQDDITKEIVTNLRVKLTDGEQARTWARGTENIVAWHLAVQATELFLRFSTSDYMQARRLAERALAADPTYVHAMAIEGFTYWWEGRLAFRGDAPTLFAKANAIADRAMELDGSVAFVIGLKAMCLAADGEYADAVALLDRGVGLYPGNADMRAFLAAALGWHDRHDDAIREAQWAMSLNPHYPPWYPSLLARSLTALGKYQEALSAADEVLAAEPNFFTALFQRTVLLGLLRRDDEARAAAVHLRNIAPGFRRRHVRYFMLAPSDASVAPVIEVLREAGLPE